MQSRARKVRALVIVRRPMVEMGLRTSCACSDRGLLERRS
jgi:hypothetical protein